MPGRIYIPFDVTPELVESTFAGAGMGAVYVGPQSEWENPFTHSDVGGQFPSLSDKQLATMVTSHFQTLTHLGVVHFPNWRHLGGRRGPVTFRYPSIDKIRSELSGKHLACNCPLDEACHADVLLQLANPEPTS
jgi:hypothetical protein